MVGDACFCDILRYRAFVIEELHRQGHLDIDKRAFPFQLGDYTIADPGTLRGFLAFALIGMIIPTIFQTYFVTKLIHRASKKRWLDVGRLTKHSTITVILISFTDPDAVILLPFNPEAYQLEGSPFPNKPALSVTAFKALEDAIELVTQVAYLATLGGDSFVLMNLGFTLLMMVYDVIAKVLR